MATHFDIFGLAPSVDLDVKALEQRHRELSLECHPDRVAKADARTRLAALEKTTTLNDAFKVLKDPVRRAGYLLKLRGVDLDDERVMSQARMPLDFLQQIMELREALDAAKAAHDAPKARAMADQMGARRDEALEKAQAALRAEHLAEAAQQLGRLKYFARFVEDVEAFEEEARA